MSLPLSTRGPYIKTFDSGALFAAIDQKRAALGLSWQRVADQMWEQSADLNARRRDHPISPAALTNLSRSRRTSCQHALFALRWLERTPESFLSDPPAAPAGGVDLPVAEADRGRRLGPQLV